MVFRRQGPIVDSTHTDEEANVNTTEPLQTRPAGVITTRQLSIVCAALGVPRDDRLLFWRWAGDLSNPKTLDELNAYVDVLIADRCLKPADDLLSRLIQLEVDGEELTVDDIRTLVAALVAAPKPQELPSRRKCPRHAEEMGEFASARERKCAAT
jgi:hypothetical protein